MCVQASTLGSLEAEMGRRRELARRLATARVELRAQDEFDVKVVNHEVGQAAREVVELLAVPGDPGASASQKD